VRRRAAYAQDVSTFAIVVIAIIVVWAAIWVVVWALCRAASRR
jgi:hypothetical protein